MNRRSDIEEVDMARSDQLTRLASRAKEAEDRATAAESEAKANGAGDADRSSEPRREDATKGPAMPTVRQATIDLLRKHGLNTWFGNPGSSELSLMEDFPSDFSYLLGLQELVPVGMADGFSQVTGRPALVQVHTAPGLGGAMGALYNASLNKTPLVVIAGNQRRAMQNQKSLLTNEDAVVVPRPWVKWSTEPATASEVPAVLARAIHIAT